MFWLVSPNHIQSKSRASATWFTYIQFPWVLEQTRSRDRLNSVFSRSILSCVHPFTWGLVLENAVARDLVKPKKEKILEENQIHRNHANWQVERRSLSSVSLSAHSLPRNSRGLYKSGSWRSLAGGCVNHSRRANFGPYIEWNKRQVSVCLLRSTECHPK